MTNVEHSAMTAAQYVALARGGAIRWLGQPSRWRAESLAFNKPLVLNVFEGEPAVRGAFFGRFRGGYVRYESVRFANAALAVVLTPENIASEDALVRALLASAIIEDSSDEGTLCAFLRDLGVRGAAPFVELGFDAPVGAARAALIDSLLAETSAAGNPEGSEQPTAATNQTLSAGENDHG